MMSLVTSLKRLFNYKKLGMDLKVPTGLANLYCECNFIIEEKEKRNIILN